MKNKILAARSLNTDIAALLMRLIIGGLFIYYGWLKVVSYDQILPVFTDIIGIGAERSFILLIFAELVCGFLVLVGFLTRLSVIPIFIAMFVAYFIAHAKDPFSVKQLAFVYLLLTVVIFVMGSGRYSVDGLLQKRKPS